MPRRSRRLCGNRTSPPWGHTWNIRKIPLPEHKIVSLDYIKSVIERHNDTLPFTYGVKSKTASSEVWRSHRSLEKGREAVDEILRKAQADIDELLTKTFIPAHETVVSIIASDTFWYRNGNLMSIDLHLLDWLLENQPPEDLDDFAEYARNTISNQKLQLKSTYEIGSKKFFEKSLRLQKCLVDAADAHAEYLAYHFTVFLIAQILPKDLSNLWPHELRVSCQKMHDFANDRICEYWVDDEMKVHGPRLQYWNCAAARRELWTAYSTHHCNQETFENDVDEYFNLHDRLPCFHQSHIKLLGLLQLKAHKEIRSNVWLAAKDRLPAELTTSIFELAIQAEGLPANPEDWCTELFEPLPRQYRCSNMKWLP